jgi:small multidrug resistance family-3 protein
MAQALLNQFYNIFNGRMRVTYIAWFIFVSAAILEVGGNAVVRKGLRGNCLAIVMLGFVMLGCYGIVVNILKWDFSRLLGVYVSIFALISISFGRYVFQENVSPATWIGLFIIIFGGMVIQFGNKV